MIQVQINLPDTKEVGHVIRKRSSVGDVMRSVETIYPNWTSIVLTITRDRKEVENDQRTGSGIDAET